MLIDIINCNKDSEVIEDGEEYSLESHTFKVKCPKKGSVLALKQYTEYSEAEKQFLIPSSTDLNIPNMSTQVD